MSGGPGDAAAKRLEEERDLVEISPAQPDDASRIDAPVVGADVSPEPAHVKHERTGRMQH
jgi:hypothetical protein